jgi:large subunit ribosomal protein L33
LTLGPGPARSDVMAKKKGEKREIIRLVCTEDEKHYVVTSKNKQNTPDKLELKKYNPNLRKTTVHKEKR